MYMNENANRKVILICGLHTAFGFSENRSIFTIWLASLKTGR